MSSLAYIRRQENICKNRTVKNGAAIEKSNRATYHLRCTTLVIALQCEHASEKNMIERKGNGVADVIRSPYAGSLFATERQHTAN
jgi:hypothetical protein